MHYSSNRDIDRFIRQLMEDRETWAFTPKAGNKHSALTHVPTQVSIPVAMTPSCPRAFKNLQGDVRQLAKGVHKFQVSIRNSQEKRASR